MVVDSSAIIAVFQAEDDAQVFTDAMAVADELVMNVLVSCNS